MGGRSGVWGCQTEPSGDTEARASLSQSRVCRPRFMTVQHTGPTALSD